jgi:hypothetical protein
MNALRFTIREIIVLTLAVAILLGWIVHASKLYEYRRTLVENLANDTKQLRQAYTFDRTFANKWQPQLDQWTAEANTLKQEIKLFEARLEAAKNLSSKTPP